MRRILEAINDFSSALKHPSTKNSAFIGLGDCYRLQANFEEAIENYSKVVEKDMSYFEVVGLKRAICYVELKQFSKAQADISKVKTKILNKFKIVDKKKSKKQKSKNFVQV